MSHTILFRPICISNPGFDGRDVVGVPYERLCWGAWGVGYSTKSQYSSFNDIHANNRQEEQAEYLACCKQESFGIGERHGSSWYFSRIGSLTYMSFSGPFSQRIQFCNTCLSPNWNCRLFVRSLNPWFDKCGLVRPYVEVMRKDGDNMPGMCQLSNLASRHTSWLVTGPARHQEKSKPKTELRIRSWMITAFQLISIEAPI